MGGKQNIIWQLTLLYKSGDKINTMYQQFHSEMSLG